MIQLLVAYNLVFFLESEHCEIWFIVEDGVTDKKIIMFADSDALENHEIS